MLEETLEYLITDQGGLYIDGTFGGGGHTGGILERLSPDGRVIGCDADRVAIETGVARFADRRLVLRRGYYGDLCETIGEEGLRPDGLLLDLGVSSRQLDSDQIGLSYRTSMPLDMRFDPEVREESAADLVNRLEAGALATLLRRFGEEPAAWKIAQAIATERQRSPISTTADLRQIVDDVIPERFLTKTLSRVFQALRIAVNDELGDLERGLECFTEIIRPGGRIVVLTYHSLEDRIVKHFFRDAAKECRCPPGLCSCDRPQRLKVITRRPVLPSEVEIESNRRARSAKLRVAERI
jgi:16S rRNA (cytosine1402-N4)-methyltransferase